MSDGRTGYPVVLTVLQWHEASVEAQNGEPWSVIETGRRVGTKWADVDESVDDHEGAASSRALGELVSTQLREQAPGWTADW